MKRLRWGLFIAYCLFIVYFTILSRKQGVPRTNLRLFWSYREMLAGDSNWKEDVVQNLKNILFFIPFGLFMPIKDWKAVLITAVTLSVAVEITQYFGGFGLAEVDDVICNTLGAMIGFGAMVGLRRVKRSSDET